MKNNKLPKKTSGHTTPQPRPLSPETNIEKDVSVFLPADGGEISTHPLTEKLRAVSSEVRVVADHELNPKSLRNAYGPLVVIGNLADSKIVRELYFDFNCVTDRWYPGPAGFEVRTLIDPYGNGYNIIHLGYSDKNGRTKALDALTERIGSSIPFCNHVGAHGLPVAPHEVSRIRTSRKPELQWQYSQSDALSKGYIGYLTGESDLIEEFNDVIDGIVDYGIPPGDHHIKDLHLRIHYMFNLYRLLETTGLVRESVREPFLSFLLEWAENPEHGLHHIQDWRYAAPDYPRQNHGLLPALAFTYLARYFERYYPGYVNIDVWLQNAERVYDVYSNGNWKPLCDGLCHGWYLSQPAMLEYAFLDPKRAYLESGGARKAAECAMTVVNNRGWMPTAGDYNPFRQYPGPSLRTAAAWYGEDRFWFAHQLAPQYRSMKLHMFLTRAFDVGLDDSSPPGETGIRVIPIDPLVYNVFEKHGELYTHDAQTPPTVPIESSFDKVAVRTGWSMTDDYLLIDGLGGGSHAFEDAMGIVDYERRGLSLVVQEDGQSWSSPEDHSVLTIVRDGIIGRIPSFAALCESREEEDCYYVRTELPGYAGTTWTREIWLFTDRLLLVHDTVHADESGMFAIEAHFRMPGNADAGDRSFEIARRSFEGEEIAVVLSGIGSEEFVSTTSSFPHPRYTPNPGEVEPAYVEESRIEAWKRRYNLSEAILTHHTARYATRMEAGESVSFSHVVQGVWPGEERAEISMRDGTIEIAAGNWKRTVVPEKTENRLSAHPATRSAEQSGIDSVRLFETESTITDFHIEDSSIFWGSNGGEVGLLELGSEENEVREKWRVDLNGAVHAVGAVRTNTAQAGGDEFYCAGYGANGVACIDKTGTILWRYEIERDPTSCPWWELYEPSAVDVLGIPKGDGGEPIFVVGCGDLQIRAFDLSGNLIWKFLYVNGVPANLNAIDTDGDGTLEIVAGGEIKSNQSTARILSTDGSLLQELIVEGWTSRLTAIDSTTHENHTLIAVGSTRGATLRLYRIPFGRREETNEAFSIRLGGTVTGLCFLPETPSGRSAGQSVGNTRPPDTQVLISSTTQGFVSCWSVDGKRLWSKLYESGISHMGRMGDYVFAVETNGLGYLLDPGGHEKASFAVGTNVGFLSEYDGRLLYADGGRIGALR